MNELIYGAQHYLQKETISKIVKDAHVDELNLIHLDAGKTKIAQIIEEATTIPFFSDEKVIVVENCVYFGANNGLSDQEEQQLLQYLQNPLASTHLVFQSPSEKLDTRKKWVKECIHYLKTHECKALDDHEMRKRIDHVIRQSKIKCSAQQMEYIVHSIGTDLDALAHFGEMLLLQEGVLDDATLNVLLPRKLEDDVFELLEAFTRKRKEKVFQLLQDFQAAQIEPIQLIAVLASQLRFHFQVNHLFRKGLNEKEITSELGVHPYRVKKTIQNRNGLSVPTTLRLLHELSQLDQQIKSGKIEKRLGLELFFIQALTRSTQ